MLDIDVLQGMIVDKRRKNKEKEKIQQMRSDAFRMYICPDCGSNNVSIKIGFFLGGEKYRCNDCGSSLIEYSMF